MNKLKLFLCCRLMQNNSLVNEDSMQSKKLRDLCSKALSAVNWIFMTNELISSNANVITDQFSGFISQGYHVYDLKRFRVITVLSWYIVNQVFYILIHSIYNYISFNYYLINGYNSTLLIINIIIILVFFIALYLTYLLKIHFYISLVVTIPPLIGLFILMVHSKMILRVNYNNLFFK